jgi:hypothetical protein
VFDPWLLALISKHARQGVLVDANLLFIYSVGILDPALISKIDGSYSDADFVLLSAFLGRFDRIVTTPNIMTEVSNLASNRRKNIGVQLHGLLRGDMLQILNERYVTSRVALLHSSCDSLGIADAATSVLGDEKHLVLTNDLDLSLILASRNVDCINYTNILRPLILRAN